MALAARSKFCETTIAVASLRSDAAANFDDASDEDRAQRRGRSAPAPGANDTQEGLKYTNE